MRLTTDLINKAKQNNALRRWAVRAYALRYPPPYQRPNMEFHFDAWNGISSLHCWNGRQIGEDNTGPYPYNEPADNQYEVCKFRDSRNGLFMNMTNLRLVMPAAGDAYQLTTLLRNRYIDQRKLSDRRFNLIQAYLFSKFAVSLPAYLTRRKDNPVRDGTLQPLETAFYMLGTAPFMLLRQLMVRGEPTPLDPKPLSADSWYRLADASGVLISTRSRACPATPKLVREFFDVIMNGSFGDPLDSAEVQRVLDELGEWNRFYSYTHAGSRLELLIKLNQALTARALIALQESTAGSQVFDTSLLQAALDNTLQRSYANVTADRDAAAVVDNIVRVLVALLLDHDDGMLLDKLRRIGFLDPDIPANSLGDAGRRISQGNELIYQACRRDLLTVQKALNRSEWPLITEDDLLQRTGGSELSRLLAQLEAAGPG